MKLVNQENYGDILEYVYADILIYLYQKQETKYNYGIKVINIINHWVVQKLLTY